MLIEYLSVLAAMVLLFNLFFLISVVLKDNSIVDICWGLGIMTGALYSAQFLGDLLWYQILALTLVVAWGVRLSLRIFLRNLGKGEDWRYQAWRKKWNPKWFYLRSYLQVFIFQALLSFVVVLPAVFIQQTSREVDISLWLLVVALATWVVGFVFESLGDWQLDRFKKNRTENEILDSGLWRYTRHPNYFGEALQWWGVWLLALSVSPAGWWTIVSPLLVTVLVVKISGIPIQERKISKDPKFKHYMQTTNKFIPGPPKKKVSQ